MQSKQRASRKRNVVNDLYLYRFLNKFTFISFFQNRKFYVIFQLIRSCSVELFIEFQILKSYLVLCFSFSLDHQFRFYSICDCHINAEENKYISWIMVWNYLNHYWKQSCYESCTCPVYHNCDSEFLRLNHLRSP